MSQAYVWTLKSSGGGALVQFQSWQNESDVPELTAVDEAHEMHELVPGEEMSESNFENKQVRTAENSTVP